MAIPRLFISLVQASHLCRLSRSMGGGPGGGGGGYRGRSGKGGSRTIEKKARVMVENVDLIWW